MRKRLTSRANLLISGLVVSFLPLQDCFVAGGAFNYTGDAYMIVGVQDLVDFTAAASSKVFK